MNKPLKMAVFVSGSGTNLQAIIDSQIKGVEIALVFSNNPGAYALKRARSHGIPVRSLSHRDFPSRVAYDREVLAVVEPFGVGLVVLAGYMRILSPMIIRAYRYRIMNLHPALLPSFPGTNSIKRAMEYGVKVTGCTVHFVDEGVDTGPIIIQSVVRIREDDTLESLTERVHGEEHRILPEAIRLFAEGRLRIEGRRVKVLL